jgi:hypothetical protein
MGQLFVIYPLNDGLSGQSEKINILIGYLSKVYKFIGSIRVCLLIFYCNKSERAYNHAAHDSQRQKYRCPFCMLRDMHHETAR